MSKISRLICGAVLLLSGFYSTSLLAKEVEIKLPNGMVATADYQVGGANKPAIVLIHGYLQTRNFPLIYNLSNALKAEGYTVLAPTLTLGISHRAKSLSCEAIHTHTMEGDVDELSRWIEWLSAAGHKNIVLVGHSFGAVQILSYATGHPSDAVKKLVLISVSDVEHKFLSPGRVDRMPAIELAKRDKKSLGNFELGFCREYRSPAPAYLSYVAWTQERVLKTLSEIKIPHEAIYGDGDLVVSKDWPERVRKTSTSVTIIPEATHFFEDSRAEFELFERLQYLLNHN
jgi:pimeloyl-ACP methyl ester carboxylesterase